MEHLKANPYYSKYAQKIDQIKERQPAALVAQVEKRKAAAASQPDDPVAASTGVGRVSNVAGKGKKKLPADYLHAPKKTLASVMKMELVQDKTKEEVSFMWTEYWKTRNVICAVVPSELYKKILEHGKKFDKFLLPIPRESGYEFILTQFSGDEVHFTPLANYQVHKENAPECLALVHYTDLQDKLNIVLMKGDYDTNVLNGREAQYLANQLQLYYTGNDPDKLDMVRVFNTQPEKFDHNVLISHLETLELPVQQKA